MGFASYVDDCLVGFEDEGEISKSEDKKTFKYTGTIAQILALVGFEAKCMVTDHEQDDDAIKKRTEFHNVESMTANFRSFKFFLSI